MNNLLRGTKFNVKEVLSTTLLNDTSNMGYKRLESQI